MTFRTESINDYKFTSCVFTSEDLDNILWLSQSNILPASFIFFSNLDPFGCYELESQEVFTLSGALESITDFNDIPFNLGSKLNDLKHVVGVAKINNTKITVIAD